MVYEIDDEKYVVLSKQGNYKYILNDIVCLLRIEHEKTHYVYIKNIAHF